MSVIKGYEKYFERNHNVPDELKKIAVAIMKRFCINGLCDGMYICNVIAHTNNIGDGMGNFTGETHICNPYASAIRLQCAYGCNIFEEDLEELKDILLTGYLDKAKAVKGINRFISFCENQKTHCDDWRVDYLDNCISRARLSFASL